MRLLVIGKGPWGNNIFRDLVAMKHDVMQATHDWREALDSSVDAVFVATPFSTHASIVRETLRRSFPTWVEKPAFQSVEELDKVVREYPGDPARVPLFVDHVWCFHPTMQLLKQQLADDGDVLVHMRAQLGRKYTERKDCPLFWDWGAHLASVFLYLTGPKPTVTASTVPWGADGLHFKLSTARGPSAFCTIRTEDPKLAEFRVVGAFAEYYMDAVHGEGYFARVSREGTKHMGPLSVLTPLETALAEFLRRVGYESYPTNDPTDPSSAAFTSRVLALLTQLTR